MACPLAGRSGAVSVAQARMARAENANNNGRIRLSVRQAAVCLGITPNTAAKGFHDLQAKGFIVQTQHACLGTSGAATSPAYELTELALPYGDRRDGRKLYRDWRPGKEFPVHKASANNPEGRNGRIKPRLKNSDASVIEFETKRKVPSQK